MIAAQVSGKKEGTSSYVELTAGTTGYILVTDLPKETEKQ
jgi:hypothetical protein